MALALDALLELGAGRCRLSDLAPCSPSTPSATGLALEPDDLVRLDRWADAIEVRWGLDAEHRTRFGYPEGLGTATWADALDRLLAGAVVQSPAPVEVAPGLVAWDDLGGDDLDAVGRLADALEVVGELVGSRHPPKPMSEWCDAVDRALTPVRVVPAADHWQLDEATELLAALRRECEPATATLVGPVGVRRLLRARLGEVSGRARLRTGGITVTSTLPLRGVPFRVLAILGLDDDGGSRGGADGDDVLARRPRLGERDPALDRRATLCSTWSSPLATTSSSPAPAATSPPTIPCRGPSSSTSSSTPSPTRSTVARRLRSPGRSWWPTPASCADPVNLGGSEGAVHELRPDRPWTFDRAALAAGRALVGGAPRATTRWAPLPPPGIDTDIDIDGLHGAAAPTRPAAAARPARPEPSSSAGERSGRRRPLARTARSVPAGSGAARRAPGW